MKKLFIVIIAMTLVYVMATVILPEIGLPVLLVFIIIALLYIAPRDKSTMKKKDTKKIEDKKK